MLVILLIRFKYEPHERVSVATLYSHWKVASEMPNTEALYEDSLAAVVVDLTIGLESPGLMRIVLCTHFFVVQESFVDCTVGAYNMLLIG